MCASLNQRTATYDEIRYGEGKQAGMKGGERQGEDQEEKKRKGREGQEKRQGAEKEGRDGGQG